MKNFLMVVGFITCAWFTWQLIGKRAFALLTVDAPSHASAAKTPAHAPPVW